MDNRIISPLGTVRSISRAEAYIHLEHKPQQTTVEGIPLFASTPHDYVDPKDVETRVIGHCKKFNLSEDADREAYADLIADLVSKPNIDLHFEEKTVTPAGDLIIYVSYTEYLKLQITQDK